MYFHRSTAGRQWDTLDYPYWRTMFPINLCGYENYCLHLFPVWHDYFIFKYLSSDVLSGVLVVISHVGTHGSDVLSLYSMLHQMSFMLRLLFIPSQECQALCFVCLFISKFLMLHLCPILCVPPGYHLTLTRMIWSQNEKYYINTAQLFPNVGLKWQKGQFYS